jgi:hypothetical protein
MTIDEHAGCPAHADFDPLSAVFLSDPFAVLHSIPQELNVFSNPENVSSRKGNPVGIDHFCLIVDAASKPGP